jgi:hypothetical protein
MNNIITDTMVIVTGAGRHFHLFDDCRAMAQGQRNSDKYGRELHPVTTKSVPRSEVIDDGMFGCRECYKRADLIIPAEADRVAIYAARAAARAERRAAKAAALAAKADAKVAVEPTADVAVLDAEVDRLVAMINEYLSQFNLTVATAA